MARGDPRVEHVNATWEGNRNNRSKWAFKQIHPPKKKPCQITAGLDDKEEWITTYRLPRSCERAPTVGDSH